MELTQGRILLVAADPDTRFMMTPLLWGCGYAVTTAGTAADALSLAKIERFACHLIDHQLPDGAGVELCRRLRALDSHTPIILCSSPPGAAERQRTLAAGAQDCLHRLMSLKEMEQAIHRQLHYEARPASVMRKSA